MEKALNIRLTDGSIVTKPCYIANQGTKYSAIPTKYLTNLKYVDNKGEVKNLLGTLTHTVRGMGTEETVTEFEFRFHILDAVKERNIVFVIMGDKETYAIGAANFVINFLKEKLGDFSLRRNEEGSSFYGRIDVLYGEINLGSLSDVIELLDERKDLASASSLYETIRKDLLLISTDSARREALIGDVVCTPLDNDTMKIVAPIIESPLILSRYGSRFTRDKTEHGKMRIVDTGSEISEKSMLFFDGVKWYHYGRGERTLSHILQAQDRLLAIARQNQLGSKLG